MPSEYEDNNNILRKTFSLSRAVKRTGCLYLCILSFTEYETRVQQFQCKAGQGKIVNYLFLKGKF